ncbi:chorismate--pyruvate lyase family protein [Cupriavidus basilensis]
MSAQYARRCGWTCHLPFDTAIPPNLRHWVTGEGSLTARLVAASEGFRVRRLFQASARPYLDEWQALGQCGRGTGAHARSAADLRRTAGHLRPHRRA